MVLPDFSEHDIPQPDAVRSFDAARHVFRSIAGEVDSDSNEVGDDPGELPDVPGYQLHHRIGHGAAGDVYVATRHGMPQRFAVKVLNQRLGERKSTQRAWRELQVLSQLHLHCLPRLIDYGEVDGRLLLVTELIDGSTLIEHCHTRDLDLRQRVELIAAVADAVHMLHEHGVLHRDIKPSNIIIDPGGQPMIVDLGIAALLADDVMDTLTADGVPIGSPAFMSPEQARGERATISTRSDVYGLGATAYITLTGQPPFDPDATLHELLHRITHEPPRDPRSIDASIPKPLANVLLKAVASEPADRYASAAEFAADLRRWLAGDAVEAGTLGPMQRFCRAVTRHPIIATAALCTLLAIVFCSAVALTTWRLNYLPSDVVVDHNGIARLFSKSGNVLHTWRSRGNDHIRGGWLIDADEHNIDRDLVILGFKESENPAYVDQLLAFDLHDPETVVWSSGDRGSAFDPPPPISRWTGDRYRLEKLIRADVFDDPPGDELIATHRNITFSPTSIRVYDMAGNVLYEAWHDGEVNGLTWLDKPRRLVCVASNSECTIAERGKGRPYSAIKSQPFPQVVFALDIHSKQRHGKWISARKLPQTMSAAWYKCLLPLEEYDRVFDGRKLATKMREALDPQYTGHARLEVHNVTDGRYVYFAMHINADGDVVHRRRTSEYDQRHPDYDITKFHLGELPKYNRQPPIPALRPDDPDSGS